MQKKWTDEEVQFLKFAYPNKDFTVNDICKALKRNYNGVTIKAKRLKLKRPKEIFPDGFKRCLKCKTMLPLCAFRENGRYSTCNQCKKECVIASDHTVVSDHTVAQKQCSKCKEIKAINEFQKNSRSKDGLCGYCKECAKKIKEKSKLKLLKERGW